ncbi:hypothetical protein F5B20DRAFT_133543 [Whalleya microplaca]|nr:hypothetical protein F5B20DRAFT_133543 [Whalleya microplaca]
MSSVRNITVPWVPLAEFDWSFGRSGPLPWNLTVWSILAVFTALPIWTTVELTVWVLHTFERWRGIYFWSVLVTTWGVSIHAVGFVLKFCVPEANWILATVLAEIGWVAMVSGFSIVMWSRLHLVIRSSPRTLRLVLAMIILNAFLFHIPTIIFQFLLSNQATHARFLPFMNITEKVQIVCFSIQEIVISVIYVWGTLNLLKCSLNDKAKNTMTFLIIVQVIVILIDVLVIVLDYLGYFTLKAVLHSFNYAFKLQIEFVVLNEFKHKIAKGGITGNGGFGGSLSFDNKLLGLPNDNNTVDNNSGVTVVVAAGDSSLRTTQSDLLGAQHGHAEEQDAFEMQYLGRYGRAL